MPSIRRAARSRGIMPKPPVPASTGPEGGPLLWTEIANHSSGADLSVTERLPVAGGWLVRDVHTVGGRVFCTVEFVRDARHSWWPAPPAA